MLLIIIVILLLEILYILLKQQADKRAKTSLRFAYAARIWQEDEVMSIRMTEMNKCASALNSPD
jgi:hypothetical protein